jgi:hypothetical protein
MTSESGMLLPNELKSYTSEDICAAFSEVAGYKKPRIVAPISLMLLGGLAFEVLGKLGLKTTVNWARVKKLFHLTNIIPKTLQESGFRYSYSLPSSLADWRSFSAKREFI